MIPKEFINPINQAIRESLVDSIEKGYSIVDVKVTLYDGSYHDVDSSYKAFQTAGVKAFKEACRLAKPMLLEPIMKVDIEVDEKYKEAVLLDIAKKGGLVYNSGNTKESFGDVFVPLSKMLDYDRELDVLTNKTAIYSMKFERYDEVFHG